MPAKLRKTAHVVLWEQEENVDAVWNLLKMTG